MRKLAILTFVTLDGVMQSPGSPEEDNTGGFRQGGWAAPYWDDVMDQVNNEAMAEPYDILFGRKTYESFASFWPTASRDNPETSIMNNARKYVVTSTLKSLDWQNAQAIDGDDAIASVDELKSRNGPLLQIHGSCELVQGLLAADLVDELRLWIFPVIVGNGKRLFGDSRDPARFGLKKSSATQNGVLMALYERQRT